METYKRLLAYAKPYGRYWPGYLSLSIVSVIFGVVNYALIDPLLTVLFTPDDVKQTFDMPEFTFTMDYVNQVFQYYLTKLMLEHGSLSGLLFVCILLLGASFISNLARFLSQNILVNMRTRIMKNVRNDLFYKITKLHVGYYHNQKKGDILSSVSNDVNQIENTISNTFHIVLREPLLIIGFLVGLFYLSPQLTLVTLITLPVSAVAIGGATRKLRRGAVKTQALMGQIISYFEEAISGIRIIKAFNAQKYVRKQFNEINDEHKDICNSIGKRQNLASPLSEFLGIAVAAAVLFVGGWLQLKGQLGLTLPQFIVYIAFYWRVLEPSKAIANAYAAIQRGIVSGERILKILDVEPEIKNMPNPVAISEFKSQIEFKDVCFKYASDPVLKHINLTVEKGKMIALVGPSGAGKSTMADLLPRFYDVTSGSIELDGLDIRKYDQKDLISLMGIVTQEAILFNDTVYNNISFGMEGVTMEQVQYAARVANAEEFILQLPQGYNTNIGDRGANLSGGQRQRLAIARAVLKNPPILILDEATSALDTESERLVQDALTKLMKNRTSIVIAHRLSTIQFADEIIVLQKGEIVERGKHDELINKKGLYSHLCDLQAFS